MRRIFTPLIAIAVLSLSGSAFAHDVPYGPAGCGLGAMVIGTDAGFMQMFAGTTNGTSGNQTFGITSGTLGCEVSGGAASAKAFIEANREALAKDISRGAGETIDNLAAIGECSDPAAVGATLQAQFQTIFPSAAASDRTIGENVVKVLELPALNCAGLVTTA